MQRAHAQAHAPRRWRLAGSAGGGAAPDVPAAPPFVLDVIHVSSVYHDVYHSLGRDTLLIHRDTCITC